MPVLNLVIRGNEIVPFTRRISCDLTQIKPEDSAFWSICVMDCYKDEIYCLNQTDLDAVKAFLTGKSYTFGADENITPEAGVQSFLDAEQAKGRAGVESKSDIYDKLKVQYPDQVCVDARL